MDNSIATKPHQGDALAVIEQRAPQALALATHQLNDAVHDQLVPFAAENGSATPALTRYVHFANATAKAVGLVKSDAAVVAALGALEKARLALVRWQVMQRIPYWVEAARSVGGLKPHNRVLHYAKAFVLAEGPRLGAMDAEELAAQIATMGGADEQ